MHAITLRRFEAIVHLMSELHMDIVGKISNAKRLWHSTFLRFHRVRASMFYFRSEVFTLLLAVIV